MPSRQKLLLRNNALSAVASAGGACVVLGCVLPPCLAAAAVADLSRAGVIQLTRAYSQRLVGGGAEAGSLGLRHVGRDSTGCGCCVVWIERAFNLSCHVLVRQCSLQDRWEAPTLWQWQGVVSWAHSLRVAGVTPAAGIDIVVMTLNKTSTLLPGTEELYELMGIKVRARGARQPCFLKPVSKTPIR